MRKFEVSLRMDNLGALVKDVHSPQRELSYSDLDTNIRLKIAFIAEPPNWPLPAVQ